MRLTQVLNKHLLGRWFNDKWKGKKDVTISNAKLRSILEASGKQVYDAVELFGVEWKARQMSPARAPQSSVKTPKWESQPSRRSRQHLADPRPEQPQHETPAYVYTGRNLIMGLQQAQAITNTIRVGEGLPERIVALEGLERLKNQDEMVAEVIKTSLMFDATQEKLAKMIDVTRLGLPQPVQYGIPGSRSRLSLLAGLLGLCERLASRLGGYQSRMVLYKPLLRATNVTADGHRLVLARRQELALLADRPLAPVAPPHAVDASRAAAAPELAPVSPFVHLHQLWQYDWGDVAPVAADCRHSHVHTLFIGWNGRLEKYVNDDQLGALSLMCLYAAALNMARQQAEPSRPVVLQCVTTDGRLVKPAVLQLNTLALPDPTSGEVSTRHQPKNMLWTEPAAALYDVCRYEAGRPRLDGYNADVFPRLLALYMNGLIARTVPQL
ncbi:39S ribosomal protein L37, mitochondrial-like [Pollicipes pollicipes]|uniref:39S ribosomal protein L37, mitochondrial-like n=1 Tax=Pollicipes pollicipes TaxID=41117 RepID=UPI0018850DAC|nr:39S ribosomal protein L37, mitochondrial-like [Pollicipes pollicipes]